MNQSAGDASDAAASGSDRFADAPVSRREFVRLSSITAGAIALPGAATGAVEGRTDPTAGEAEARADTAAEGASSPKLTDLYAFVVDRTPADYEVPTLLTLTSADGFDDLRDLGIDPITTTDPAIAAYAELTEAQVADAVGVESVESLRFSPGSNPFWRLGAYPRGVFPDVRDSVGFVDYEQLLDGLDRLRSDNPDRLRVTPIGESPGHDNLFLDERDPKDLVVAELTNDVTDRARFREKEKALFVLSIHGDERSGAEAGSRMIERILAGEEPAIERLLDDVALVFLYANPDGWVSRNPQYDLSNNSFKRQTATGVDPNRQYPTVGWIDAEYNPAEPNGTNLADDDPGVDEDVPDRYAETVPDALAVVEHFRDYENLSIGSDLHGMFWSEDFIEGLVVNDQYTHEEFHDLYEWNRRTDRRLEAALGPLLDERRDFFEELNADIGDEIGVDGDELPTPDEAYAYGTILDTIGYTTTGTLISWMSQPEEKGGLGVRMMAHEMGWDNRVFDRRPFVEELIELQVIGYQEVIRSTVEHAARTVEATVETGNARTAYVTTDALTRTSADLAASDATRRVRTREVDVGNRPATETVDVPDGARSLSLSVRPDGAAFVKVRLRDPTGRVVGTFNPMAAGAGGQPKRTAEWYVESPTAGEWSVELKTLRGTGGAAVSIRSAVVLDGASDGVEGPDPVDVLGYEQRAYSVSPLAYFRDYADALSAPGDGRRRGEPSERGSTRFSGVSIDDVRSGALFRGRSDVPAVDNLVVSHAEGIDDPRYVAALDAFVEAGGNLVLTDRGVALLGPLSNGLASELTADDVTEIRTFSAFLSERTEGHPLLAGTRPIQRELWKPAPLGYPISVPGTAPLTVVDVEAFERAGGSVAGLSEDDPFTAPESWVSAGSLTGGADGDAGIHVIAGLLPPAEQGDLHPFGLLEYTATFLGHTMLTNALGYRQERYVDGELVATYGGVRSER
ncbi:M14 family zinc carboxypeptidase [Halegenticoccus soli]|uniref:M14 family zinc carboxypeptidase n=1 Tax=Halegenticoccus soli TaxID=1985678 RepID=UPI000C6E4FDB|nr:M14 family zinc carboxypeptidase [Halegenticoccus soli]